MMKKIGLIVAIGIGLAVVVFKISSSQSPVDSSLNSVANTAFQEFEIETSESASSQLPGWRTYQNTDMGFSVKTPPDWLIEESPATDRREIKIFQPQGEAYVLIAGLKDDLLREEGGISESLQLKKTQLENNSTTPLQYQQSITDELGAYMATGTVLIDQQAWVFQERGLVATNSRVLLMQGLAKQSTASKYRSIITQIMNSFNAD